MKKVFAILSIGLFLQACSLDTTGGAGMEASADASILDHSAYANTSNNAGFSSSLGGWKLGDGKLF